MIYKIFEKRSEYFYSLITLIIKEKNLSFASKIRHDTIFLLLHYERFRLITYASRPLKKFKIFK